MVEIDKEQLIVLMDACTLWVISWQFHVWHHSGQMVQQGTKICPRFSSEGILWNLMEISPIPKIISKSPRAES